MPAVAGEVVEEQDPMESGQHPRMTASSPSPVVVVDVQLANKAKLATCAKV